MNSPRKTRIKFQNSKETAGSADLHEHWENAAFGYLRHSPAFKCVRALLIARRDERPYPAERLKLLGDAVCNGDFAFLDSLRDSMDFFTPRTIHDGRWRLADPLRFHLVELVRSWSDFWGDRPPAYPAVQAAAEAVKLATAGDAKSRSALKAIGLSASKLVALTPENQFERLAVAAGKAKDRKRSAAVSVLLGDWADHLRPRVRAPKLTLSQVAEYLEINFVKVPADLRKIWKNELLQGLAPAGRPLQSVLHRRRTAFFFTAAKEKRAREIEEIRQKLGK